MILIVPTPAGPFQNALILENSVERVQYDVDQILQTFSF